MKTSLRKNLLLVEGLSILSLVVILGSGIIFFTYRSEIDAWHNHQEEIARSMANQTSGVITDIDEDISLFTQVGEEKLLKDPSVIKILTKPNPALNEVIFYDRQGRVIASYFKNNSLLEKETGVTQTEWFKTATAGKTYMGRLKLTAENDPFIIYARMVSEDLLVAVRIRPTVFWDMLSKIQAGNRGSFYLTDGAGNILAHSDIQRVMTYENIASSPQWRAIQAAGTDEWFGEYRGLDGSEDVGVAARVPGTDWYAITELDTADAYAASHLAALLGLVISLTVGALVLWFTYARLGRLVIQPLDNLTQAAERVGLGDYHTRVETGGGSEIELVGQTFNTMAANLQSRETQLSRQTARLVNEVNERRQAEEALRRSEANFRTLIENATDVVSVLSEGGITLYQSPSLERIFGYHPVELAGTPVFERIHPDDIPAVSAIFEQALENLGIVSTVEFRYRHKDGSWREVVSSGQSILNMAGEKVVVVNTRDITEIKTREHELQAIASISNVLPLASSLEEILPLIMEQAANLVNALGAAIALHDPDSGEMVYKASSGKWSGVVGTHMPAEDIPSSGLLASCTPCFHNNHECALSKICPFLPSHYHSMAVLPLHEHGETIGLLWFGKDNEFTTTERKLLQAACGMASGALQRVMLMEQSNRQAVELEQRKLAANLRSITERLSYTLELRVVLENMLDGLAQITTYDSAAILLLQPDHLEVAAERGFIDDTMTCSLPLTLDADDPYSRVIITRQPYVILDIQKIKGDINLDRNRQIHAWMGIPLIGPGGEMIGILNLSSQKTAAYGEQELELTRTFATQAVIAVENARLFGEVQRMATTDGLTGIYNRRYFFELAQRETLRAHRAGSPLAAIMIDIDHFKRVNDTYGHAAGDEVLQSMALVCNQNVRDVDILGRYGGEEFTILMPDTRLPEAVAAAERLRQKVSELVVDSDAHSITITISVGVAVQEGEEVNLARLIKHADDALYAAKQAGRNRVVADG